MTKEELYAKLEATERRLFDTERRLFDTECDLRSCGDTIKRQQKELEMKETEILELKAELWDLMNEDR